jgi:hypothetical protein
MTGESIYERFLRISGFWESELILYSEEQLTRKPSLESWSLGQVYEHLIMGTLNYHIKQVEQCLSSDQDENGSKSFLGKIMFFLKSFPPVRVNVPPSPLYTPKQPENKEKIQVGIRLLKKKMKELSLRIDSTVPSGKSKHPGLGYLNAKEWFQLIEMHFRHHLRQKKRLSPLIQEP